MVTILRQAPQLAGSRLQTGLQVGCSLRGIRSMSTIKFGPYEVTDQVFVKTPLVFGVVNIKPLTPGHVLICPRAPHRRLTDLSVAEVTDLFRTVQLTQRLLAKQYFPTRSSEGRDDDTAHPTEDVPAGGSFTIAVQDGAEAGQTVPHVHVHVIPRLKGDRKRPDDLYGEMAGEKGNVGGALWDRSQKDRPSASGAFPPIEDSDRVARSAQDMNKEASMYRERLREMGVEWSAEG